MKPRILITMHYMEIGGAETALIGLLDTLDPKRVEVDLFIYSHQGPMMKYIPLWVTVLPQIKSYSNLEKPILDVLLSGCFGVAFARVWAKIVRVIQKKPLFSSNVLAFKYTEHFLPDINPGVRYDLAISFLTPHTFLRDKVEANRKVAWIHTDYSKFPVDIETELPVWSAVDNIVSISSDVTKTFLQVFPSLADKIIEIENILSPSLVRKRATLQNVKNELDGEINLVSVGRFSFQKNFDNVPSICRMLIKYTNRNVKWYLIGYGSDEEIIRQKIKEAGMEDHVIILGLKQNPYPYIAACDLYVQPSRYEGKSVTVREAQILCKLVVITEYATASSQIQTGLDGIIVPMDNDGCAKGIAEIMSNLPLKRQIVKYLDNHDYGNEEEVEKIYHMLG